VNKDGILGVIAAQSFESALAFNSPSITQKVDGIEQGVPISSQK
jgi:hypothetical protein